jgi:lysophospholipase L1-like esterase
MADDIDQKPRGIYDEDTPSWKTNLDGKDTKSDESEASEASSSEIKGAEESAGGFKTSTADASEKESLYKQKGKNRSFRSRFNRRKTTIGIAIASTVVSGIVAITFALPNLLLNQLKEMLIGRIGNVQIYQQRKYRQKNIPKFKNFFSKDGRMAQRMLAEMEQDGYRAIFGSGPAKNSIVGLEPFRNANGIIGPAIGDNFDEWLDRRHPWRSARWKTKRANAFKKVFGIPSTSPVDAERARDGPDKDLSPEKQVNKNLANDILDETDDTAKLNPTGEAKEGETDADRAARDDRVGKLADDGGEVGAEIKEQRKALLETGEVIADDSIVDKVGRGVIDEDLAKKLSATSPINTVKSSLNVLDPIDKICTIRTRAQGAIQLARAARSYQLIRYAMSFVNAADDSRRGNANPKLVNELMKRVMSEDKNGNPIGGSPGFSYMMKSKFSKSRNNSRREAVAVDGKLTGIVGKSNDTIGRIPGLGTTCPIAQNPVTQVGVAVGSLVIGFFTGGSSTALTAAASQGTKQALKEAVEQVIKNTITKEFVRRAVIGVAFELSFEAVMGYMDAYIQKQLALPFTGQEKGGQLGDILVAGAGASNKQRSLNGGMVPATVEQYAQAEKEYIAWRDSEFSKLSFKDKLFNSEQPNNLLFNVALATPTSVTDFAQKTKDTSVSLASSALNPFSLFGSFAASVTSKVSAEDEVSFGEYTLNGSNGDRTSLATDPAGNLQVIMRSDIEAIDPEANKDKMIADGQIDAQSLQPISGSAFANHVSNCVENPDIITQLEEKDDFDCLAKKQETKEFKAHLAYLDTTDAFEAEFFPEEIEVQAPAGQTNTAQGGNNKIYTIGDSLTVGMRDAGQLKQKYTAAAWDPLTIQAKSGDRVEQAIPKIQADKNDIASAGTIVIMLGTNKSNDFPAKIKQMIDTIRAINPSAGIYWMNASTNKADYSDINNAIQSQSAALKYKVIDWNAEFNKNKAKYRLPDGIHLDAEGYKLKSDFLIAQLGPPPSPLAATAPSGAGPAGPIGQAQTSPIPGAGDKRIATSILPQVTAMFAAARADGVELLPVTSGWRDPQKQIALRKQNCPDWQNSPSNACSPPTAKPGSSMHETGQAIDFGDMCFSTGGSRACPGNRRWEWLKANAARFGFKPLSSEAWHWSTTGR